MHICTATFLFAVRHMACVNMRPCRVSNPENGRYGVSVDHKTLLHAKASMQATECDETGKYSSKHFSEPNTAADIVVDTARCVRG